MSHRRSSRKSTSKYASGKASSGWVDEVEEVVPVVKKTSKKTKATPKLIDVAALAETFQSYEGRMNDMEKTVRGTAELLAELCQKKKEAVTPSAAEMAAAAAAGTQGYSKLGVRLIRKFFPGVVQKGSAAYRIGLKSGCGLYAS